MKQYELIKDTDENGNENISVSDKPKRRLDLVGRLVCLLIAVIIWLWTVNFNDTDVTETMVLKIQITGLDVLEDNGMMIYGLDKREITVTVKGSNRDLKKYKESEYKVTVDVGAINEVGQYTLPLSVTTPTGSSLTIAESEPLNVNFSTDYIAEKTVPLDVQVINYPSLGLVSYTYEYQFADPESNSVTIRGPKTVIDSIETARFNVDGSFAMNTDSKTFSGFALSFLDKNLNPVNIDGTEIDYSTEEIEVNVDIFAHKQVPVRVEILDDKNKLIAKPSSDAIEVWGAPSEIMVISEYVITIEKAEVGKITPHEVSNKDLPDGVNVKENVIITVSFEEPAE